MNTLKRFILIPLIGAFLCACGAAGGSGTNVSVNDVGNIEGTVTDATSGAVIAGVTVQVGDKSNVTGNNGVYSIQDLDVGSRTATATKTGYQNYNGTVTVTKGTTVTQNIQMTLTATAAPSAPAGLTATAGNGQITISWNSVSGATSYNIYWSNTTGVTKTNGTKITDATSPYTHTGLTNGTTYYYVVTAGNSYGESSESSQLSAIPQTTPVAVGQWDAMVWDTGVWGD